MTDGGFDPIVTIVSIRDVLMGRRGDVDAAVADADALLRWAVGVLRVSSAPGMGRRPLTPAERSRALRERKKASARVTDRHEIGTAERDENVTPRDGVTPPLQSASESSSPSETASHLTEEADKQADSKRNHSPSQPLALISSASDARAKAPSAASRVTDRHEIVTEIVTANVTPSVTEPVTRRRRAPGHDPGVSAAAWRAYAAAYFTRYGVHPTRNSKVNGQMASFTRRVPAEDVVSIIIHYLRSQNARYVASGHSVGCLLADAEKLRTEALTGRQTTAHAARRLDRDGDLAAQHAAVVERLQELDDADRAAGVLP